MTWVTRVLGRVNPGHPAVPSDPPLPLDPLGRPQLTLIWGSFNRPKR